MFRYLMVLTISAAAGLQVWLTLFNNFAVEAVRLDGSHIGIIQSVREVPGFMTFFVIYALVVIPEHRLSALSIVALGVGLSVTGWFPSYAGLMATTVLMSFGFHYFETTRQSLTLQYFDQQTSPGVFGRLRSLGAAANIGVGILIYLAEPRLSFPHTYLIFGTAITLAGLWALTRDPTDRHLVPQRKRMILKKRYWLYYFLTFMAGARRQIFMAFAVFLLVKKFHYSVQEVTTLFVINNGVNYFLSPMIGRWIVRFGERKVLSLEYACLIVVFLAYAMVESRLVAALLYILDHVFFNFSMAVGTYFQKIGDPRDIAPSMAVGFTINHAAAVVLPAIGGLLWMVDYRIPFAAGALMAAISLIAVQWIRLPAPNPGHP